MVSCVSRVVLECETDEGTARRDERANERVVLGWRGGSLQIDSHSTLGTDTHNHNARLSVYFHSRRSKGCENAAPSLSASLHLCVCASPLRALINAHSL